MFIDDRVRKCVVFLGAKEKGAFRPKATAFYVAIQDHGVGFRYLVTAEHVVSGLQTKGQEIWVGANLTNGSTREDRLSSTEWWMHPGSETKGLTDVALTSVDVAPDEDLLMVPLSPPDDRAATGHILRLRRVGAGHEIFITGLFRSHYGNQRNVPIVRVGNIAMMRDELVRTEYCGPTDAYLVEARSVHGLSGSPVFINIGSAVLLLGLMHGHFDVEMPVAKIEDVFCKGFKVDLFGFFPALPLSLSGNCDDPAPCAARGDTAPTARRTLFEHESHPVQSRTEPFLHASCDRNFGSTSSRRSGLFGQGAVSGHRLYAIHARIFPRYFFSLAYARYGSAR
jgi:hypothetical protein